MGLRDDVKKGQVSIAEARDIAYAWHNDESAKRFHDWIVRFKEAKKLRKRAAKLKKGALEK